MRHEKRLSGVAVKCLRPCEDNVSQRWLERVDLPCGKSEHGSFLTVLPCPTFTVFYSWGSKRQGLTLSVCLSPTSVLIKATLMKLILVYRHKKPPSWWVSRFFHNWLAFAFPGSAVTAIGIRLSTYCHTCCCHLDLTRFYQPEPCTLEEFGMFSCLVRFSLVLLAPW